MPDQQPIKTGDTAPDFQLVDSGARPRRLSELTRDGPCVVIFYRGHW